MHHAHGHTAGRLRASRVLWQCRLYVSRMVRGDTYATLLRTYDMDGTVSCPGRVQSSFLLWGDLAFREREKRF